MPGELAQRLVETLNSIPRTNTVLDVGCGTGIFASLVLKMNESVEYHGCDINSDAVEKANRTAKGTFWVTDIEQDLKTSRQYEVVLSLEVLEHVQDKDALVQRMAERLQTGGALIITTPNGDNPVVRLKYVKDRVLNRNRYDEPIGYAELRSIVSRHLSICDQRTFYAGLYQIIVAWRL
jgi:2-polyprenyl-3-methyl-5-hydroxy-6-metoxy-1,4-benzoquinol methylase